MPSWVHSWWFLMGAILACCLGILVVWAICAAAGESDRIIDLQRKYGEDWAKHWRR